MTRAILAVDLTDCLRSGGRPAWSVVSSLAVLGSSPLRRRLAGRSSEAVGFGEALAQIRGHHLVSFDLYGAGDEKGAAVHAGHPIAEILDSVRSELEEHDPQVGEDLAGFTAR